MTVLTLEYHLRGIVRGTTNPECVRQDISPDQHTSNAWDRTGNRYYTDPTTDGYEQYDSQIEASSYTTGFSQQSGEFCDCFAVHAQEALNSDDTVAHLDIVANDPTVRYQRRIDAAQLLEFHIWPDAPMSDIRSLPANREDIVIGEWIDAGMTTQKISPTYRSLGCVNSDCQEIECLADIDLLRETGRAECMACGTEQPIPSR
jgi:hypothetical protein